MFRARFTLAASPALGTRLDPNNNMVKPLKTCLDSTMFGFTYKVCNKVADPRFVKVSMAGLRAVMFVEDPFLTPARRCTTGPRGVRSTCSLRASGLAP